MKYEKIVAYVIYDLRVWGRIIGLFKYVYFASRLSFSSAFRASLSTNRNGFIMIHAHVFQPEKACQMPRQYYFQDYTPLNYKYATFNNHRTYGCLEKCIKVWYC
jgi:hypothetical protein